MYCFSKIHLPTYISSFEMNKVNSFTALTAPFPNIFLSNLCIAFKAILLINPDKISLVKGMATFVSTFLAKLPNQ